MFHLLIVILDDLKTMPRLLSAWHAIGLPGATILQSAGAHRATTWLSRVGLGALDRLFEAEEVRRRTLLVAIEDDGMLDKAIAEAERVVGGFDRPNSGLLLVLPVQAVRGLHKVQPKPPQQRLPRALRPDWALQRDAPVEEAIHVLDLQPTIVDPDTPLDEVSRAMLAHPRVHVISVVGKDGRLVGIIDLSSVADTLFYHIMPEEFLSETTDLEEAMRFADLSRMQTAADAMQDPVWVRSEESVKDAFKRMHESGLPGLPVVDELYRVVGYINLLELMAVCLGFGDPKSSVEEDAWTPPG